MKHWVKRASAFGAMTMLLMAVSSADAGWGWYASSGGSGGSWGSYGSGGSSGGYASGGSWGGYASSGGSWGSHGSSGGGVLRRVAARIHSHHHHSGGGWGSSGGSWGGYASSGGSSGGSWGSSGGGLISRIRAHRIAHRAHHSGGSSGGYSSWGSSGGYATATVSYGSSGSVSYGSSGSVSYSSPAVVYAEPVVYESYSAPACEGCSATGGVIYDSAPAAPTTPDVPAPTEAPMGDSAQSVSTPSTLLAVQVPADAEVYVNGYRTKATGTARRYRSAGLQEGREYTYEVRVVSRQDGTEVAQTKFVTMKAGDETELDFAFNAGIVAKTSLTLHVPEGAKVTLAGAETKMEGTTRVFSTSSLEPGKAWEDYVVRVVVERDGQSLTKERTITVRGGEQHELAFDFDAVELASNN